LIACPYAIRYNSPIIDILSCLTRACPSTCCCKRTPTNCATLAFLLSSTTTMMALRYKRKRLTTLSHILANSTLQEYTTYVNLFLFRILQQASNTICGYEIAYHHQESERVTRWSDWRQVWLKHWVYSEMHWTALLVA